MTAQNTLLQEAQQDAVLLEDLSTIGIKGTDAIMAMKSIKLTEADMGEPLSTDELLKSLGI